MSGHGGLRGIVMTKDQDKSSKEATLKPHTYQPSKAELEEETSIQTHA